MSGSGVPDDKIETRFEARGSLEKPGRVGRLIRLALGVWLVSVLITMLSNGPALVTSTIVPPNLSFWLLVAVAFHITPYVVNIGFGKNWRRRPRVFLVVMAALLVVVDLAFFGRVWAPPLGAFVWLWLVYFCGHLGVSFVLAAFLSTPGCEMRAIPHLWTMATGRDTREHYCPGPLDAIDRWESSR